MQRLLITGGSGLLGSNLAKLAVNRFKTYATYYNHPTKINQINFIQLDLSNQSQLSRLELIKPQLIIHCAALTNVDYCQSYPQEAFRHNVIASENIAHLAKKFNACLIHISTDAVFDGQKGNYQETDLARPINVYAQTKLTAEHKVLSIYPSSCIIRTNIYGRSYHSKLCLAEWMISRLAQNQELPGLKDVYFSPILVNHLGKFLLKLVKTNHSGILHLGGSQSISKLKFAHQIAQIFNLDSDLIKPTTLKDLKLTAPRGKNISLNSSQAQKLLGMKLPNIRTGLIEMKRLYHA